MRTRAAIIRETGKPWEVTTLELDQPGPGEVLIKFAASGCVTPILATGVNGMQLLGAQNYVQQLFYGAALVIAVVLSRRLRRARA